MDTSPIRLIAVDLDGTVLDDRKQLTPRTLEALRAAGRQGVLIVPATGRTHAGLPPELLALPGVRYAITSNGARVMDLAAGKALRELYIPRGTALAAYDALAAFDCMTDLFQDGQGYTTPANRAASYRFVPDNLRDYVLNTRIALPGLRSFIAGQKRGIEKLTLFFLEEAERRRAWTAMESLGLEVVSSLPLNMELNARGVNKGAGLLALADALGLPVSSLMACGDGGNDTAWYGPQGWGWPWPTPSPR